MKPVQENLISYPLESRDDLCKTRKRISPLSEHKTKKHNSATFSTIYTNLESRDDQCKTRKRISPLSELKIKKNYSATFSTIYTNLESGEQPYILPIVSDVINKGRVTSKFSCLFDTGSQRSYLSKHVVAATNLFPFANQCPR